MVKPLDTSEVLSRTFFDNVKRTKSSIGFRSVVKSFLGFFVLFLYALFGGLIFYVLHDTEEAVRAAGVEPKKDLAVQKLLNISLEHGIQCGSSENITQMAQNAIATVLKNFQDSVSVPEPEWTYLDAVLYSEALITTIGYHSLSPKTTEGRIFAVFFALIGIPITFLIISEMGRFFSISFVQTLQYVRMKSKSINMFPYADELMDNESLVDRNIYTVPMIYSTLLIGIWFLFCSLTLLFINYDEWTFFDAIYFYFMTFLTVGIFGSRNNQPFTVNTGTAIFLLPTILIGLCLISMLCKLFLGELQIMRAKASGLIDDVIGTWIEEEEEDETINTQPHHSKK